MVKESIKNFASIKSAKIQCNSVRAEAKNKTKQVLLD